MRGASHSEWWLSGRMKREEGLSEFLYIERGVRQVQMGLPSVFVLTEGDFVTARGEVWIDALELLAGVGGCVLPCSVSVDDSGCG